MSGGRLRAWLQVAATTAIALAAASMAGAQVVSSRTAGPVAGRFDELDHVIAEEMKTKGIPGLAVVIVQDGQPVYRHGFGLSDIESGAPMTTELLVQAGSVTKVATALLASDMARDGTVSLDAPIRHWVSGLAPAIGALTLRQLLTQSSGLRDESAEYGRQEESALLDYARAIPDSALRLPAGEAFSYSNPGFAVAGLVLQEAAHVPFADLLRRRLLQPMGTTRATLRPTEAMTWPRAAGHVAPADSALRVVRPVANDTRYWPAGYLYASTDDLARLVAMLAGEGSIAGSAVVPRESVDSMLVPRVDVPGMPYGARYGFGIFVDHWDGVVRAWHPGTMPGFSTLLELIPERHLGVAVVANRDAVRLDRVAEVALRVIAGLNDDSLPPPAVEGTMPTAAELRALEGSYSGRFPLALHVRDGHLVLSRFGAELPVQALGANRYAVQPAGAPRPDVFRIMPAARTHPAYIQMFLWSFPITRRLQ